MIPAELRIPEEVFSFSGQTTVDTWSLKDEIALSAIARYSNWLVEELHLCMQRIRDLVDSFPFWQHRRTGRPPAKERDLMIVFLLRQLFDSTFRRTQTVMECFRDYFRLNRVPHHTVLSRKNRSRRWSVIWRRFHEFVRELLPRRKAIIATDATGYSGRKRGWKETPYAIRANQDWVKLHAAIEVDRFVVLSHSMSKSNVHDSQLLETVWNDLPENVVPKRSLADSAYNGKKCLQVAKEHGATPMHGIKKNAVYRHRPETEYQRMVNFAIHWPNRYKKMRGMRNHAETAFGMIQSRFGYRIRCRTKKGRKNEVQAKVSSHNIRMLALMSFQMEY